jgi:hypothetical protein
MVSQLGRYDVKSAGPIGQISCQLSNTRHTSGAPSAHAHIRLFVAFWCIVLLSFIRSSVGTIIEDMNVER